MKNDTTKPIYFEHDFFMQGVAGMMKYLTDLMKPYKNILNNETFPIYIANTGDEKFLFDMIDDDKIYSLTPRWTFNLLGINSKNSDRTNPQENGAFDAKIVSVKNRKITKTFSVPLARRPVEVGFQSEVRFSNIFEYFRFVEIYLILSTRPFVYKFVHAGKIHIGIFTLPELDEASAYVDFSMESEKRERKLPINFVLTLQFPAYQIYGIPGTNNEGFNGSSGNGEAGNVNDFASEPMNKIIHNIYSKFLPSDPNGVKLTQIITKQYEDKNNSKQD